MLFSFVKELNKETSALLTALGDRGTLWNSKPNVVVWAFYVGDDPEVARQWWSEQQRPTSIVFSITDRKDPGLAKWNLEGAKSNVFVLGDKNRKVKGRWADVKPDEVKNLGDKLLQALNTNP